MINRVRGTQDILNTELKNFIIEQAKKYFANYNFSEIQTPILEPTKLFIRSLGQTTDVVSKEMYMFPAENEEESICLRPEITASCIRAYLENNIQEKPWKIYNFGSAFRKERPQKGRWREFTQFSLEIINSESVLQDAQFIKMLDHYFASTLKIENYVLKINFLGCKQDREKHKEALSHYLERIKDKICPTCQARREKNILRVFDCKNESCQAHYQKAPVLTDYLCESCNNEWQTLQKSLQLLSVSHIHDTKLVRGLDYYNKTVFEFTSNALGAQSAFCGGGRYSLGQELDAKKDLNCIGAGIGLGRLELILEEIKDNLNMAQKPALNLILPLSQEQLNLSLLLANELTSNNICTEILFDIEPVSNMMRKANKLGAKFVLIIGQDEQNNGTVSIKNMQTGINEVIKQNEVVNYLKFKS